jgi:hypothetical protein
MKTTIVRMLALAVILGAPLGAAQQDTNSRSKVVRGWISDERCARGRASDGIHTATNPDCAKRCAAQGKKLVLIVPTEKTLFDITNQEAAQKNVGDYVEVAGSLDQRSKSLHIDSLKMLEQGRAMCGLPPHRK